MRFWIRLIVQLLLIISLLVLIYFTGRMHALLAIVTIVVGYFLYAILSAYLDEWLMK